MSSHQVASSFLSEKSPGSPAFSSVGLVAMVSLSYRGCSGVSAKGSSSLVISISGSGVGVLCLGMAVIVRGKGSSIAGNSCHDEIFRFL